MKNVLTAFSNFILSANKDIRKRRLELAFWALLLSFAYYPFGTGFIVWFALVRPVMIIANLQFRQALTASYYFGFCFNLFSLYWIAFVTPPGTVATIAIVAGYYMIMLVIFNRLYQKKKLLGMIALPFLWVGLEYFRTLSEFAFPWSELGYTQSAYLYILQIVSVISVHGLTFIIVCTNILIWQIFRPDLQVEKKLTAGFISMAVILALLSYGWIVTPKYPIEGDFKVALLQGAIPLDIKWDNAEADYNFEHYDSLVHLFDSADIDLFVWPETSLPTYLSHTRTDLIKVREIIANDSAYHLIGALGANRDGSKFYNSCYQFNPAGDRETEYDKVKLVPFAEQVPYQDQLPFLKKEFLTRYLTFIETYDIQWWSDFHPGDSLKLFKMGDINYAVLICFESTFPEYAREALKKGANFIVSITNDTWFENTIGMYMHSNVFLTRAVENRCWMVRVANSGYSYVVDQYGRKRLVLPKDEVAVGSEKIQMLETYSIFTEYGDLVGKFSFLITVLSLAILILLWLYRKIF